jgi:intracellular multiplication protein IcmO
LVKVAKMSADIPEDIVWPLKAYLGELPGYDPSVPHDKQRGDEPSTQHGFAQFYFTATFTQLAVSLGHILKVENGDIDMRDILLNRGILVVNLPALETSDATLAALGKLVVAGLRGMMAQLLGA